MRVCVGNDAKLNNFFDCRYEISFLVDGYSDRDVEERHLLQLLGGEAAAESHGIFFGSDNGFGGLFYGTKSLGYLMDVVLRKVVVVWER